MSETFKITCLLIIFALIIVLTFNYLALQILICVQHCRL